MISSINPLDGILAKYKEKLDKIDKNRLLISEVIKSVTGVQIKEKELEICNNTLFIHSHPAKRQIIMFNKNEILSYIQENENIKNILEIK